MERINPIKQEKLKKWRKLKELGAASYPHHWRDQIDSIEDVKKYLRDQEEGLASPTYNKPLLQTKLKSREASPDENNPLQKKPSKEEQKTHTEEQKTFYLTGRLMRKRDMGKAAFFNIQQGMESLQCYIKKQDFPPLEKTENPKREEKKGGTEGAQKTSDPLLSKSSSELELSLSSSSLQNPLSNNPLSNNPLSKNPLSKALRQTPSWIHPRLIHPWNLWKLTDIGDILGLKGKAFKTKRGELSLRVEGLVMLCKSLEALPEKYHGLEDKELKYRYRHLHLIMDSGASKVFKIRSSIIKEIRSFMHKKGFMEVETPVLQPIYGGALAEPFETQFRRLSGQKMYLKISPEIYLKKLLVGGFEKVFEIGKNFRNEGIDKSHNPEFTMMEYYQAYTDYKYQLWQFEELVCHIAKEINKKYRKAERESSIDEKNPPNLLKFEYQKRELDLSRPWTRISHKEFENLIYHITEKTGEFRTCIKRALVEERNSIKNPSQSFENEPATDPRDKRTWATIDDPASQSFENKTATDPRDKKTGATIDDSASQSSENETATDPRNKRTEGAIDGPASQSFENETAHKLEGSEEDIRCKIFLKLEPKSEDPDSGFILSEKNHFEEFEPAGESTHQREKEPEVGEKPIESAAPKGLGKKPELRAKGERFFFRLLKIWLEQKQEFKLQTEEREERGFHHSSFLRSFKLQTEERGERGAKDISKKEVFLSTGGSALIENSNSFSFFWPKFWQTIRASIKQEKHKKAKDMLEENKRLKSKRTWETEEEFFAHFCPTPFTDFQFKAEILKDSARAKNTEDKREDLLKAESFFGPKKPREIFLKVSCLIKNKQLSSYKKGQGMEQGIGQKIKQGIEQGVGQGIEQEIEQGMEQGFTQQEIKQGMEQGFTQQGMEQRIEQGVGQGIKQGMEQGIGQKIEQGIKQGIKQGVGQGSEQEMKQGIGKGVGQRIEQEMKQGIEQGSEEDFFKALKKIAIFLNYSKWLNPKENYSEFENILQAGLKLLEVIKTEEAEGEKEGEKGKGDKTKDSLKPESQKADDGQNDESTEGERDTKISDKSFTSTQASLINYLKQINPNGYHTFEHRGSSSNVDKLTTSTDEPPTNSEQALLSSTGGGEPKTSTKDLSSKDTLRTETDKLLREAISWTERKKDELISLALEVTVEKEFWDPIFVTDFPLSLSPLAKKHRSLPNFAERFEPYIAGMEIGNAYTELNDPQEQRQRLMQQKRRTENPSSGNPPQSSKETVEEEKGGEESLPLDENFLHALEVGMPPTAGVGLGIERLVMILSDQSNIKDSILFPVLREKPTGKTNREKTLKP